MTSAHGDRSHRLRAGVLPVGIFGILGLAGIAGIVGVTGLSACSSPSSTRSNPAADPAAASEESHVTPTPLPANLHVVVFFDTERGHEHLDVRVIATDEGTYISGVRADESRANPITRRIDLTGELLAAYTDRIAALSRMPRCEPLARFPNEPLFRIDSPDHHDEGPSLWLRENGDRMITSEDPCLGYARVAHFVYTTWMSQNF